MRISVKNLFQPCMLKQKKIHAKNLLKLWIKTMLSLNLFLLVLLSRPWRYKPINRLQLEKGIPRTSLRVPSTQRWQLFKIGSCFRVAKMRCLRFSPLPTKNSFLQILDFVNIYIQGCGPWPGPKWVGYMLNGLLKTGFTTNNQFYWDSFKRVGPGQTREIFAKWAENTAIEDINN